MHGSEGKGSNKQKRKKGRLKKYGLKRRNKYIRRR